MITNLRFNCKMQFILFIFPHLKRLCSELNVRSSYIKKAYFSEQRKFRIKQLWHLTYVLSLSYRNRCLCYISELEDGNIEGQQRYSLLFYYKTFMEGKVSWSVFVPVDTPWLVLYTLPKIFMQHIFLFFFISINTPGLTICT